MALLSIYRGTQAEVSERPVSDGALLFATDTKKIYLDKGSNRVEMSSLQDLSDYITSTQLSSAIGVEASARQKQDQLLEQAIDGKLGADDIIAGSNVQISHDDESGHITISATDTKDTNTTYTLTKSGSTITLNGSDGSKTSVTDANTTYSLSSFGVTATATELNYMDGVTSNVQTQLNGKAASSHSHSNYLTTTGTAAAATKLATARTISLSGDASGSVAFNGTANVSIPATVLHHGTTSIGNNANLNSYTDPGWYYCALNATAVTISNSPTDNAFAMLVLQHAGTMQMVFEYMTSSYKIYVRNYYNEAWGSWQRLYTTANKPTASEIGAAAASHNHSAANITSGTLAVACGGTGITSNPSMLVNLGSTSAASVFAASPRPGITGTLAIAHGGTGATSAASARSNIGAAASDIIAVQSSQPSSSTCKLWIQI